MYIHLYDILDEPNPPIGVHSVNGPNYIRVLWQPATSQPIALSHYAVQLRANQTLEWTTVNVTSHATERQIQITNLMIAKVYTMRVIAYGQNTVPSQPSSITQIFYIPSKTPLYINLIQLLQRIAVLFADLS